MKNHMRINGQLFQTNKKWSHLKEKQKTWIMETAWQEYDRFAARFALPEPAKA